MNKQTDKGKMIVFSAPSGAGKTTIVKKMLNTYPELIYSISATTRKPREGEAHGTDYFFLTDIQFMEKIDHDEFIEWEKFYDYYYGTLKSYAEEKLNEGYSVVFELDVKGALNIKKRYPEAVLIFIVPPSIEVLEQRLRNRKTETEIDIKKRIDRAEMELKYKDKFDYMVVNTNLEEAIEKTKKIIDKELKEVAQWKA